MPLSTAYQTHQLMGRVRRLRSCPVAAYGISVGGVALATAFQLMFGAHLVSPFLTYHPVIILVTFVGGLGPGLVAVGLATLITWHTFLQPYLSWTIGSAEIFSLAVFILLSLVNVTVVAFLDKTLDRVEAEERHVRLLFETSPNGILVVNDAGKITLVNPAVERLFGFRQEELIGHPVETLVAKEFAASHEHLRRSFVSHPETRQMAEGLDAHGLRKDGRLFPVEVSLNPVEDEKRKGVLATVVDVSERRKAEDLQHLLFRESEHRAKNLFAVVQGIVHRTIARGVERDALDGRLTALARAYNLSSGSGWTGAVLREIVQGELAGFSERFSTHGCDVRLTTSAAQHFALIVHELATNALKYGALSSPSGRVFIEGKAENKSFSFTWREVGGPPTEAPARKGFGTVLLIDMAKQFAEAVKLDYLPEGLCYRLETRLDQIEEKSPDFLKPPSRNRNTSEKYDHQTWRVLGPFNPM